MKNPFRTIPLYIKILLAMVLGVGIGYIFLWLGMEQVVNDWLKPWGTIFIRLLKLIAIPLVFISLIKGISQMKDFAKLSRLGIRTLTTYIITTTVAVGIGIGMVSLIQPGKIFPQEKATEYQDKFAEKIASGVENVEKIKETGPLSFIVDMVPENLLEAGSDNSAMLQVIFIAILIGIAIVILGEKTSNVLFPIIEASNSVILKIIDFIMDFAPVGVLALMASMIVDFSGDGEMFASLGLYALTVILTLFLISFILYPVLIKLLVKYKIKDFIKGVFPIQLLAFSTSSSAATLPFTMEHSQKELGVSEEIASFVFPVGTTINMDGTSAYQAVAILFIAQIFGMDLSLAQMLSVVLLTVLASIGTPGVPGASVVMTVMVLTSVGIPVEGLVLILGIDRPLDMLRTVVNVTGDVFVAKLMDKQTK
ncbi:MAG: dicarboxylate/amino acid:cation symporter [Paludibacter sp.]|nr:dicarboxylate/amino acid:cation symporter [Paludibacter sp.]